MHTYHHRNTVNICSTNHVLNGLPTFGRVLLVNDEKIQACFRKYLNYGWARKKYE